MTASLTISPTRQFFGVVRYELQMIWRTRVMIVALVPMLILMTFVMLAFHDSPSIVQARALPDSQTSRDASLVTFISVALVIHAFSLLLFPLLMSDLIPKDRKFGIFELMRALPVDTGVYLAGKATAAIIAAGLSSATSLILIGIGWYFFVLPFNIPWYISVGVFCILPVAAINTGVMTLLGATQPTRRRAILLAVIFTVICWLTMVLSSGEIQLWDYLNPGRPLPFRYYIMIIVEVIENPTLTIIHVSLLQIILGIVSGILELVLLIWLVRYWFTRRNAS